MEATPFRLVFYGFLLSRRKRNRRETSAIGRVRGWLRRVVLPNDNVRSAAAASRHGVRRFCRIEAFINLADFRVFDV